MFIESQRKRTVVRTTVWVAVLGLLLGILASIVTATSAEAHAALTSVSPRDGSTVAKAPTAVVLRFSEPIGTSFATVSVTGPAGSVADGKPRVEGDTVTQPLEAGLGNGRYVVVFRVVSEDGHPVSDRTSFTLQAPVAPTMTPATSGTTSEPATSASTPSATAAAAGRDPGDSPTGLRLGLAVGVAALALAGGTALVALSRRRQH